MLDTGNETLVMGPDERRSARGLSLQSLEPPIAIAGYEQLKFLGRGAFGEAWEAVDSNSGRRVVVKFFNRRGGLDWSLLAREVDKLQYLFSDRRIVQLFAVGWNASPPYYVMESMAGGSLEQLLRTGPLPVNRAVELFREVAIGLAHAHGKGIIHCDLKPANILLDQDGNPKLADFGQSRLSHEQAAALGTLFYMAPEQADLHAAPDARWDVYALGAVVYHMLTGSMPYRDSQGADAVFAPGRLEERLERYRTLLTTAARPTAHRNVPGIDAALAEVIDRCLAVDPKARFRDVGSVLHALDTRATRLAQRPLYLLGLLGPLLVAAVMAVAGTLMLRQFVLRTSDVLAGNAVESDRFAARLLAERFGLEVEGRWHDLETEAANPRLRRLLAARAGTPSRDEVAAVNRWIDDRRAYWNRRFSSATAARYWFAVDHKGTLRAISPWDEPLVGHYFGYRDYFHGRGHDLRPDDPLPPPITRPHRSNVYRSKGSNALAVTFSVPVRPPGDDEGAPIGVLAMEVDVGHFTEFHGRPEQRSALIDLRPDVNRRAGRIVAHERLHKMEMQAQDTGYYIETDPNAWAGRLLRDYHDPLDDAEGDGWLAVVEPVLLHTGERPVDSGWVVLVQERYTATLRRMLHGMWQKITITAAVALGVVVLVVAGLWAFVLLVIQQGRTSALLARWRRWRGLPTLTTAATSTSTSVQTGTSLASVDPSPVPAGSPVSSESDRWPS